MLSPSAWALVVFRPMVVPSLSARTWPASVHRRYTDLLQSVPKLPAALILLSLLTATCYRVNAGFAITAFLCFVFVVLYSLAGSFRSSILLSVLAGLSLEFFFLEPVLSFRITRLQDWLALATFVLTAVTVSFLSSRLTEETLAANAQREYMERLYSLAQQLLAEDPGASTIDHVFERFREHFGIVSICISDSSDIHRSPRDVPNPELERATAAARIAWRDADLPAAAISIRCLQGARGWSGAVGFQGLSQPSRNISPLAALAVLMLERSIAHDNAAKSAALAETEAFRTAILDALAHEFKTPLSTILAAVGGIQESGALQPAQLDLAQVVESETVRLGSLTTRLLKLAHLDRDDVKPRWTLCDVEELALGVVKRYSLLWPLRRYSLVSDGDLHSIFADPELLRLALSQLLDNASKYSPERSPVDIEIQNRTGQVSVTIWNQGPPIDAAEQDLIFERFYRGESARQLPGTGLGLYVVRRIAAAHGGAIELLPGAGVFGTGFRFSFSVREVIPTHV